MAQEAAEVKDKLIFILTEIIASLAREIPNLPDDENELREASKRIAENLEVSVEAFETVADIEIPRPPRGFLKPEVKNETTLLSSL